LVYFSFTFSDVMRVNNIRQTGKIGARQAQEEREFKDRSIWESRRINDIETLKNLMRTSMPRSSTVCVLIGTDTWQKRWVKYEIARSVIEGKGLLAIHLNGLNHVERKAPDPLGFNPLWVMGVSKSENGTYILYEKHVVVTDRHSGALGWEWKKYADHTAPVRLPRYMPGLEVGFVAPLAAYTVEYEFDPRFDYPKLGGWFDASAIAVGR
jgi:hypothetical protein